MEKENNKLTTCAIQNTKEKLISVISKQSDKYGDKLLDFMERYHVAGLKDATVEQLYDYIMSYLYKDVNEIQK